MRTGAPVWGFRSTRRRVTKTQLQYARNLIRFSDGYYFPWLGLTTYANLIHVKPSGDRQATSSLTFLAAVAYSGARRRLMPSTSYPIFPSRHSGFRGTLDWRLWTKNSRRLCIQRPSNGRIEAVYFGVGSAIRRAGGITATISVSSSISDGK